MFESVISVKAGIHFSKLLDARLRGHDNCELWHGSELPNPPLQIRSRDFQSRQSKRDWKSRLQVKNCKDDFAYNEPCPN